jgi:prepilin-type N-terminal cleavage/methylation domain-containing protein/prepilin-type processing-associated H-X9-DG protein
MNGRRGFTLIELLVVIAIIAILMGILMPGLMRVKEQARITACRSNLKQYAVAARMYSDDNDGEFPYSFTWLFNEDAVNCNWHDDSKNLNRHPELAGVMWRYLEGLDIHLCPTFDVVAREMSCQRCKGATIPVDPQYGYTMNSYLNGDAWGSVPSQYRLGIENMKLEGQVRRPAETFYFSEENSWSIPGLNVAGINDNNLRSLPNNSADSFATFHRAPGRDKDLGYANACFVDGHVEEVSAYPPGNTFQLCWPGQKPAPTW